MFIGRYLKQCEGIEVIFVLFLKYLIRSMKFHFTFVPQFIFQAFKKSNHSRFVLMHFKFYLSFHFNLKCVSFPFRFTSHPVSSKIYISFPSCHPCSLVWIISLKFLFYDAHFNAVFDNQQKQGKKKF